MYLLSLAVAVAAKSAPKSWEAADWWMREALCIHSYEGAWNSETGNGYSGGMQFSPGTWASVGGVGAPSRSSPREQLYRAWLVYRRDGGSWREWPTSSRLCGLR